MTWLSPICFSAVLAAGLNAARISGSIELRDSRDPGVRNKKDYSGVVVWLQRAGGSPPASAAPGHARMIQKNKTFTPHVLAIQVGTAVDFPNFDPMFHSAFSNYNGQLFDVGLYPPGSTRSIRFGREGIVRVFCNIHANMSAIIAVLNTPRFAVAGKDGTWSIRDVPEGEYTLHVFHERATQVTLDGVSRRIEIRNEPMSVPPISISESGYLAIPHKNKYGREYPPVFDDGATYPAVRP